MMMCNTDRLAVLLLGLLPGLALAQADAGAAPAAAPAQVAAATPTATTTAPASGNKVNDTKDQLTRMPSSADLRPTGPITINANKAELVQGSSAVYVGNVTLDSDTLKMDGDRLELKRTPDGQYTAKVTGTPAHASHAGTGPDNPPMTAHAKTMTYDSRAGTMDLLGEAEMTKGADKVNAETIHYFLVDQRYEAAGGDAASGKNGRVTIVIPQVPGKTGADPVPPAAPAAASPAAAPAQSPAPHP